ncbi:MAG: S24 family peptidase [Clostridiales bacterium]|nr:S24 family peptidase [Clostridiales bacterium]
MMAVVDQRQDIVPTQFGNADASEYFSLKVVDDGMSPTILQSDEIVFHRQQTVDNGELAVITIGDEKNAILRRVYYGTDGTLLLTTDNTQVAPMIFDSDEARQVHIHGKVVYLVREITHNCF